MQFRQHPAVRGKRDFYPVDPRKLKIDPGYNVRDLTTKDAKEKLSELKESIRSNGVKVPLEVRLDGKDIFIVAGHRRHAAVMELIGEGELIQTVPAIPEPKGTNEIDRTLNLVISNSGEPLSQIEKAEVIRRLVAFGWSHKEIARRLGWKSPQTIDNYLALLEAPAEVREMVRTGEVSATTAANVVRRDGASQAAQTLRDAKEHGASDTKSNRRRAVTPKDVKAAQGQFNASAANVGLLVIALRLIAKADKGQFGDVARKALKDAGVGDE